MGTTEEATAVIASVIGDDPLADVAAAKLAEHRLLAPDLPEPDMTSANGTPVWRLDKCLMTTALKRVRQVRMWIPDVGEIAYSPQDARKQAYMLLAAANHAEQAKTRRTT